jgi:putative ABC transport system permease protein
MIQEIRYALRTLLATPTVSAVVIASLAVGIGANTVVFSWIQGAVIRPLPGVAGAASLYSVEPRSETGNYPGASWPEFRDLRDGVRSFQHLLAFRMTPVYVGDTGRTERAYGLLVSDNYFAALGLRPALGRFPLPDEVARPGGAPVLVISSEYWQTRFHGAATAVGQTERINGRTLTIVGVAPRGFVGTVAPLTFDLFLPATLAPVLFPGSRELEDRQVRGYQLMARLAPGVTRAQAQTDLDAAFQQLARTYPAINGTMRGELLTFWDAPRGPQRFMAAALGALQAIVLLLLLSMCGNAATLLLARASARRHEFGIRLAIGARPRHVARLLLTETVLLALTGAALGAALAVWGTGALRAMPPVRARGIPITFDTTLDLVSLAFAAALGLGSGLLCGLPSAVQLSRLNPQAVLRLGLRDGGRSLMRNSLAGVQVGLATLVLIFAGLFLRSFMETRNEDPGFRRDGMLLAAYDLTDRAAGGAAARAFAAGLMDRVRALPGVQGAAIASSVPLDIHGMPSRAFTVEGHGRTDAGSDEALANTVTDGYFAAMGIPVLEGTDFAEFRNTAAPPQVIVNDAFVERYLDGAHAVGRRLQARGRTFVIAGVVRNSLYQAFGESPTPLIYFSFRDVAPITGEIHVRTNVGAESSISPALRAAARDLDPDLPLYDVRTLNDHIERNLIFRRIPARLFVVLGPLLLVLAAIGIYGVVAYTVSLRTNEIGVRRALGATGGAVIAQFVGESLSVVTAGAAIGWAIAFLVTLDYVSGRIDPVVFALVPLLLLTVAAVASWLPAQRAATIDPMVALRRE